MCDLTCFVVAVVVTLNVTFVTNSSMDNLYCEARKEDSQFSLSVKLDSSSSKHLHVKVIRILANIFYDCLLLL